MSLGDVTAASFFSKNASLVRRAWIGPSDRLFLVCDAKHNQLTSNIGITNCADNAILFILKNVLAPHSLNHLSRIRGRTRIILFGLASNRSRPTVVPDIQNGTVVLEYHSYPFRDSKVFTEVLRMNIILIFS